MSCWTYIHGMISVTPPGRSQEEMTFVLNTVLNHLPNVTGSEKNMNVSVVQKNGYNEISYCNEFGQDTRKEIKLQETYFLVVNADLRDRKFNETFKEFIKWLCRLSKRVAINDVLVKIYDEGYNKKYTINTDGWKTDTYFDMLEYPDNKKHEQNWCERIMWK